MNTITIKNLPLSGAHGLAEEERTSPQPFSVDISVECDFSRALTSDDIADTIDYRTVESLAKQAMDGKPQKLIECVADNIASTVLEHTDARMVSVALSKMHTKSKGLPSVFIQKTKTVTLPEGLFDILGITKENVAALYSPSTDGILHLKGVLYKILDKEKLEQWYKKKWETFEKKEEKYIQNNQEVSLVYNGPFTQLDGLTEQHAVALHNLYHKIRKALESYSDTPFAKGDRLETKLMKYPVSKLGVGAHKDLSSNVNAVILFNFYGTTTFYTAKDKERNGEKAYLVEPGDIVIMRGPRNREEGELRPIHYVLDIKEERLVFVCREIEDAAERVINKGNWMGF